MTTDRESDAGKSAKSAALVSFERMLAVGKDSALLRYSIGNEHLKSGNHDAAIEALEHAVALDATYTAAWKLYGSALERAGRDAEALDAYRRGIVVARQRGDRQAEKEMVVFARRIERRL
ncbi:MAG TPA: tetratricopeptide repeat protein [Casimicrobiaceae bacterium]|jgi:Flp pilus assembly protein TadD|nr:tetratricopeptide repeat protein [Casimicrobiaceae bacterium]